MLASYFALKPVDLVQIQYVESTDFNEYLDELNPLEGKPLYSLALYEQFYEDYLVQLEIFNELEEEEDNED